MKNQLAYINAEVIRKAENKKQGHDLNVTFKHEGKTYTAKIENFKPGSPAHFAGRYEDSYPAEAPECGAIEVRELVERVAITCEQETSEQEENVINAALDAAELYLHDLDAEQSARREARLYREANSEIREVLAKMSLRSPHRKAIEGILDSLEHDF